MWRGRTVSVILPCFNEEPNIGRAIEEFGSVAEVDEIVAVDNNSTDRTAEIIRGGPARLVQERRQGYGAALQAGMAHATGRMLILAEPDGTFVASDVYKLLAYSDDFDLVLGTRTTTGFIWGKANMGFWLRTGNVLVAKLLEGLFSGPSLSDCGCTLRLIHRSAYERIHGEFTVAGSHFLPEMVVLALHRKMRVIEVPVNYRERVGTSKITGTLSGMIRTGARMTGLIVSRRLSLWGRSVFGSAR